MGYAVYEDPETRGRWAGYGVPALCDVADCTEEIDRGLGYRCEDHGRYALMLNGEEIPYDQWDDKPDADEQWVETDGCNLHFCGPHRAATETHVDVKPKPDTLEWLGHILTDESWDQWRSENPDRALNYQKRVDEAQVVINHGGGIETVFPLTDKDTK